MSYDHLNPETTDRPCPLRQEACPGTQKGCAFWRKAKVSLNGKEDIIENCLLVLQYEATYQNVAEQIRTQATVQQLNSQAFLNILALHTGMKLRSLSGNPEVDRKTLNEAVDALKS